MIDGEQGEEKYKEIGKPNGGAEDEGYRLAHTSSEIWGHLF
jgi:hypothetical protein